jgi:hypothetical protein
MDDWIFYLLTINQIFKLTGSCMGCDGWPDMFEGTCTSVSFEAITITERTLRIDRVIMVRSA